VRAISAKLSLCTGAALYQMSRVWVGMTQPTCEHDRDVYDFCEELKLDFVIVTYEKMNARGEENFIPRSSVMSP